jgi:ribonucleoside-triphosphate reductase
MATALRTYHRPVENGSGKLETWEQVCDRVISHQRWLWGRALKVNEAEIQPEHEKELEELKQLLLGRKATLAGRTLWLGGTEISRTRESSQLNCSFSEVATIYDVVDVLWLLLQGTGVGFRPVVGMLNGFRKPLRDVQIVRSTRTDKGEPDNVEHFDRETATWTIKIGDSAEAWAKAAGKLVAGKYPADILVLDFSEIRPTGYRLKGYGWISAGDEQISTAFTAIAHILSKRADQLLTAIDILDVVNHLGTILSSRRSAQIALLDNDHPESAAFAAAKHNYHKMGNVHRRQSNNSIVFHQKPTLPEIEEYLRLMVSYGGSEPGMVNAETAKKRAPWWSGQNPCSEILLGNKSFCCLVEINLLAFINDKPGLERALYLIGRANYRQTMMELEDGILQEAWHRQNQFLRLCGVGLTGIAARPDLTAYDYRRFANIARHATYSMAEELGLPLPKNTTTVKPSGSVSKLMSTKEWGEVPEGIHKPLGRFIFNSINFSRHDPLVAVLEDAGYRTMPNPDEPESVLITFPIRYDNVPFDLKTIVRKHKDPKTGDIVEVEEIIEVNLDSAVSQLERYRMIMENWCDQNVSITISYDPDEIPAIAKWLDRWWNSYVAVSFLLRTDPTKTPEDLGFPYLPQVVVTEAEWADYVGTLKPVDWNQIIFHDLVEDESCPTGACPIR